MTIQMRRLSAVGLVVVAALAMWALFGPFGAYAISHPPSAANPGFWWYMAYHVAPVAGLAVAGTLLIGAWILWRRPGS